MEKIQSNLFMPPKITTSTMSLAPQPPTFSATDRLLGAKIPSPKEQYVSELYPDFIGPPRPMFWKTVEMPPEPPKPSRTTVTDKVTTFLKKPFETVEAQIPDSPGLPIIHPRNIMSFVSKYPQKLIDLAALPSKMTEPGVRQTVSRIKADERELLAQDLLRGSEVVTESFTKPVVKDAVKIGKLAYYTSPFSLMYEPFVTPKKRVERVKESAKEVLSAPTTQFITGAATGLYESARDEPVDFLAGLAASKTMFSGIKKADQFVSSSLTKLSPGYKPLVQDPFGIKEIKGLKIYGDPKPVDLKIIPPGRSGLSFTKVDPQAVIDTYGKSVQSTFKKTPSLPKVTDKAQIKILKTIKGSKDDFVTGSYARAAIVKPQFARAFEDIDVLSKNQSKTVDMLVKAFGKKNVVVKDLPITTEKFKFIVKQIVDKKTGQKIVDVAPYQVGEGGFITQYPPITVDGINLIDPRAILAGKTMGLKEGIRIGKVTSDIKQLTGDKVDLTTPAARGAFGYSFQEQAQFVGKDTVWASGQIGLVPKKSFFSKVYKPIKLGVGRETASLRDQMFYATPGPYVRISRALTASADPSAKGSFMDLLKGKAKLGVFKSQESQFIMGRGLVEPIPKSMIKSYLKAYQADMFKPEFWGKYQVLLRTKTGTWKAFVNPGGELEIGLTLHEGLLPIKQIGKTVINNQPVTIYEAKVQPLVSRLMTPPKIAPTKSQSFTTQFVGKTTSPLKTFAEEVVKVTKTKAPTITDSLTKKIYDPTPDLVSGLGVLLSDKSQKTKTTLTSVVSEPVKTKSVDLFSSKRKPTPRTIDPFGTLSKDKPDDKRYDFISYNPIDTTSLPIDPYKRPDKIIYDPDGGFYPRDPVYDPEDPIYTEDPIYDPEDPTYIDDPTYKKDTGITTTPFYRFKQSVDPLQKQKQEQAFKIQVRSKGKWTTIPTRRKKNWYAAHNKAMTMVDNYAERSYRLIPINKKAELKRYNMPMIQHKFYRDSKTKNPQLKDAWIEKSKYAIDSLGELRGITWKGLAALETKQRKNKSFINL